MSDVVLEPSEWKRTMAQLLLVNRAFFHTGIDVLWHSMDSFVPVFKLLPWFSGSFYKGIGMFKYTGAEDWERFKFYAAYIRQFAISPTSKAFEIDRYHMDELYTLPGMPKPFFPKLQHIAVDFYGLTRVPSLFLFITPSLLSLDLSSAPRYPNPITAQGAGPVIVFTDQPPEFNHIMAVLSRISLLSIHLERLEYHGITNECFWVRLSTLEFLRYLRVEIKSADNPTFLQILRHLPRLENLELEALGFKLGEQSHRRLAELFPRETRLRSLRHLSVLTSAYNQYRVAWSLSPTQLHHLRLHFFRDTEPATFRAAVASYFDFNPDLETVTLEFSCHRLAGDAIVATTPPHPMTLVEKFESSLNVILKLQELTLLNVPCALATSILPSLCKSVVNWQTLTPLPIPNLSRRRIIGPNILTTLPWPFLSSNYYLEAQPMENLAESIDSTLQGISRHPLRELKINTGATVAESTQLEMSPQRRVDVAIFLHRLFPDVEVVCGTAAGLWDEIEVLVEGFQWQRGHIFAQVDDLLARF
ncbi:hypothetical protein NMY22_g3577 [Coprinellus aureogranulatus]|nr:hypothetical protein NMY22_g3577 [Coprinellus aureogranulatus]